MLKMVMGKFLCKEKSPRRLSMVLIMGLVLRVVVLAMVGMAGVVGMLIARLMTRRAAMAQHLAGVLVAVMALPLQPALGVGGGRNGGQHTEGHQ